MDLQASSVSKRFGGVAALSGANFAARSGEVHALLGENGAGKSTFIQILAGSVRPDAGRIVLNAKPFRADNPRQAHAAGISAVFQELSLVPDLTVAQNIWFRHEPLSPLPHDRAERAPAKDGRALRALPRPRAQPGSRGAAADPGRAPGRRDRQGARARSLRADPRRSHVGAAAARDRMAARSFAARCPDPECWSSSSRTGWRRCGRSPTASRCSAMAETVASHPIGEVSDDEIIAEMLGRQMDRLYPERKPTATANSRAAAPAAFRRALVSPASISTCMRARCWGSPACRDTDSASCSNRCSASCGHAARSSSEGQAGDDPQPAAGTRTTFGLAMVPEDRRQQGLLLSKSIRENLTLSVIPRFSRFGILDSAPGARCWSTR